MSNFNDDIPSKCEEIITWLKDQLQKTGTNGFVLGLSGGIDSSVVAGLIKKAAPDLLTSCEEAGGNEKLFRYNVYLNLPKE